MLWCLYAYSLNHLLLLPSLDVFGFGVLCVVWLLSVLLFVLICSFEFGGVLVFG